MKTKITLDIHNRIIELTVLEAKLVQEALNEIFPQSIHSNILPPVDESVDKEIDKYFSEKEVATKVVYERPQVFGPLKSPSIPDPDYYNNLPYTTSSEQKDTPAAKPAKDYFKIKS